MSPALGTTLRPHAEAKRRKNAARAIEDAVLTEIRKSPATVDDLALVLAHPRPSITRTVQMLAATGAIMEWGRVPTYKGEAIVWQAR